MAGLGDKFNFGGGKFKNPFGGIQRQVESAGGMIKKGTEAFKKLTPDSITSKIKSCEGELKEIKQVKVSDTEPTETGKFIQMALGAMRLRTTNQEGVVDQNTMALMNSFMTQKAAAAGKGGFTGINIKSAQSMFTDKFDDLKPIKSVADINGRHIQAISHELRARDLISGNEKMVQSFAHAMNEIGEVAKNETLVTNAKELSPQTLGPVSAIEAPAETVVATANTAVNIPTAFEV